MKKSFLLFFFIIPAMLPVFSQSTIELLGAAGTGGPTGSGPTIAARVVTFHTTAATAFSPAIRATFSLSNQRFASIEGNVGSPGTQFGGNTTTTVNSPVPGTPFYTLMNSLSGSVNANYTACNSCAAGTGIDVAANHSLDITNYTEALIDAAGTQLQALNARVQFSDITITFNRPVSNPILHVTGLGGQISYTTTISGAVSNYDMGFTTDIDLLTPGLTLSRLSGNAALTVTSTAISNNATRFGAATTPTLLHGISRTAASGSVVIQGTNITTVSFRLYIRGDGGIVVNNSGGVVAANNGNIVRWAFHGGFTPTGGTGTLVSVSGDGFLLGMSLQQPLNISGTVFNDPDAANVNNSSGTTNTVPSNLFANLIDASGRVVASVAVNTNGTYSFPAVFEGSYTVSLSTTAGTQGATKPAETNPSGWDNTGEFNGTPNTGADATVNGISNSFTVTTTDVTNINFGINQLPESAVNLQSSVGNPGGFNSQTVPAGAFQTSNVGVNPNTDDPTTGGTVNNIRITAFPSNANSITINGTVYINGGSCPPATSCTTWPGAGVTVPFTDGTGPSQAISVDPVEGNVDVVIPFVAIDNAGKADPTPGSVTIPFRTVSLTGIVWNDADGNLSQNGAEALLNGTNSGGGLLPGAVLYANLIDAAGRVIATVPVQSNGTYTFPNLPQNASSLTVQVSTTQGTVGLLKPATTIPPGWVSTGENKNGQAGAADVAANSELPVVTTTLNVTLQNFGIQRLPDSKPLSAIIPQPTVNQFITLNGGSNPPVLQGSDPEDQPTEAVLTSRAVRITTVPANAELYYNFGAGPVLLTANTNIPNFNPANLQVRFTTATNGSTSTSFTYAYVDLAGIPDPTPATYTLSWLIALPVKLESFTAALSGNTVQLNWEVREALNVYAYEVQFSNDGINFNSIGRRIESGSRQYSLVHTSPLNGINYYRLKTVDLDGRISYSDIRIVRVDKTRGVVVFPVPARNKLHISIPGGFINQSLSISLISAEGKILLLQNIQKASQTESIDISKFTTGQYILRIITGNEVITKTITILE
jgi:Secretion system C-terminal sorting domain